MVAVTGDPSDPMQFYFGACAGGVWKTTDGGTYWHNISDGYLQTAAVGAIAVAPSDPHVLYVGMGETTIRGDVSHGDGVYTSTDGGKTWSHCGLEDTRYIGRVRVHPQNPEVSTWQPWGMLLGQTARAASIVPGTVALPGNRYYVAATRLALSIYAWTRRILAYSMPPSGKCSGRPGV